MEDTSGNVIKPAQTQFGDYAGTAAADGHHGTTLQELAAMSGLDDDRYCIVGFQFTNELLRGKLGFTVFAVDRQILGALTLVQYGLRHGEIPVVDFTVHSASALEILSAGLKRLQVQLLNRNLPEGVPLRRTARDDLGLPSQ